MGIRTTRTKSAVVAASLVLATLGLAARSATAAPGDLDPRFGFDGRIAVNVGSDATVLGGAVAPDGKMLLTSSDDVDGTRHGVIRRFTTRGATDLGFGADGVLDLGPGVFIWRAAFDGDKTLLVTWRTDPITDVDRSSIHRLLRDGSPDPTFNGGSPVVTLDAATGRVFAVAVDASHRIVVGTDDPSDISVVRRLTAAGAVDTSFSGDGRVDIPLARSRAVDFVTRPSGEILVVGSIVLQEVSAGGGATISEVGLYLARLGSSGRLDGRFSDDGIMTIGRGLGTTLYPFETVLDSTGRAVVLVSNATSNTTANTQLMRFTRSGLVDTSFSSDGRQMIGPSDDAQPAGLAIQSDGRIVAAVNANRLVILQRLRSNGALDRSFSVDGQRTVRFAEGRYSGAAGVGITPNGRALHVAGAVGPRPAVIGLASVRLA